MSKDLPKTSHRGYDSHYSLRYTGSQRDRFGIDKKLAIRSMLDGNEGEDYPENFTGEWEDFPRVARLRENLTALSQHYNLYFVAYKGWIHVYVPSRGTQHLLGEPVAVLDPDLSSTPMSKFTTGHVNRGCPHCVNHIKVGDLGDKEILLIARDNGDVVAWYTEPIARQVEARRRTPRYPDIRSDDEDDDDDDDADAEEPLLPSPRHFFADNVGASAWGLAIHKRDRLIAVSSNTQEVTVFAFALGGDEPDAQFKDVPAGRSDDFSGHAAKEHLSGHLPSYSSSFSSRPLLGSQAASRVPLPQDKESIRNLEQRFRTRTRTWRIVIPFGRDASNLPSVSFCDDEAGHADRVVALDICGYLFVAEIWTITSRHVRIPPHNVQQPDGTRHHENVMGWSVLPITDTQLLPTESLEAAIGIDPSDTAYRAKFPTRGTWIDISRCMHTVDQDAANLEHRRRDAQYQTEDLSTLRDGPEGNFYHNTFRLQVSSKVHEPVFAKNEDQDTRLAMTMIPPTGDHYTEFSDAKDLVEFAGTRGSARRGRDLPTAQRLREFQAENPAPALLRGVSFLRASVEDVEMLTLDHEDNDVGLVCHHVLTNANLHNQVGPWDMQFGRRCSMLLTIPELHLVVLGSMCGRVALLTLTRPPRKDLIVKFRDSSHLPRRPRRAFRVDAVLPLKSEERDRQRPYVCLLGIAASPVPETERVTELRKRQSTAHGGRRKRSTGSTGSQSELEPDPPRRWRLVLNYMDHTVLQYEIIRKGGAAAAGAECPTARERRARARELNDLGIGTNFARPVYIPSERCRDDGESTNTTDEEMRPRVLEAEEERADIMARAKYPLNGLRDQRTLRLDRYEPSDESSESSVLPTEGYEEDSEGQEDEETEEDDEETEENDEETEEDDEEI